MLSGWDLYDTALGQMFVGWGLNDIDLAQHLTTTYQYLVIRIDLAQHLITTPGTSYHT